MRKALLLIAASAIALAAVGAVELSGTWSLREEGDGEIYIQFNTERNSNMGINRPVAWFNGLTLGTIRSAATTPGSFRIAREAGTVAMEGSFRQGRGSGHFDFTPDRSFQTKLTSLGVKLNGPIKDRTLLLFTLFDLSSQRVAEIQSLGYRDLDLEDIESIAIFEVTPEFIREMRSMNLGTLSMEDIVAFRIHGVSPGFMREMVALGFPKADKDDALAWRIHGVGPEFVRDLRALGYREFSADDAVALRIHGGTPEYIRELHGLGYPDVTLDQIVQMKIHGVTPDFIRELRQAGFDDVPVEKLVDMRIHGVDRILLKRRKQ
jgi:hypothetical protein